MKFEGKNEGTPSNSASFLSNVKKFEGKHEGSPSDLPANTTYNIRIFAKKP
jgi:hypothetical protein